MIFKVLKRGLIEIGLLREGVFFLKIKIKDGNDYFILLYSSEFDLKWLLDFTLYYFLYENEGSLIDRMLISNFCLKRGAY